MKKTIFLAALAALVSIMANAASFIGFNADSIRISPNRLGGYFQCPVMMHNDGYCNAFNVAMSYPDGFFPKLVAGITPLSGLTVTYMDKNGNATEYTPNLNASVQYQDIASFIPVSGYWDYNMDGEFEPYGAAKWLPGDHEMWQFNFAVDWDFRSGYVVFDGAISSGYDDRGPILQNVKCYKRSFMWVGYELGDVSGDDRINIADVVLLIDYLLSGEGLDEFQTKAADVDNDGTPGIADVAIIIDMMLI